MEGNTDKSVEMLETLDKVKDRMELCMKALKEAAKLASFGQTIESIFTTNDYLNVFNCLFRAIELTCFADC